MAHSSRTAVALQVPVFEQPLGQIEAEPDGYNAYGHCPPVAIPATGKQVGAPAEQSAWHVVSYKWNDAEPCLANEHGD